MFERVLIIILLFVLIIYLKKKLHAYIRPFILKSASIF